MKFLPIFEDLQCHSLLVLVIIAPDYDTKCTSTEFLLHFVPVINLVLGLIQVVGLVVVETVIVNLVWVLSLLRILVLIGEFTFDKLANSFILRVEIQIINHIVTCNLISFVLTQHTAILSERLLSTHRELGTRVSGDTAALVCGLTRHSLSGFLGKRILVNGSD